MFSLFIIVILLFFLLVFYFGIKREYYFKAEDESEKNYLYSIFTLILFTAILLRIININFNSYWIDELFSINTALMNSASEVIADCRNDVHPPLYQLILHYYTKIAGDSETASRLLSAVFGIFSVAGVFMIANLLFNSGKALAVMLMFSVAYMPVYYSQEVRSYSLMLMLTIFTNYFFLKAFILDKIGNHVNKKHSHIILYCITSLLLLFTHYYGITVIIFNFVFLVFFYLIYCSFRDFLKNIILAIPYFILITSVFYFTWGYIIFHQYQRTFWPRIGDKNIFSAFVFYVLNPNLKNYFLNDILIYSFTLLMSGFFIYYLYVTVKSKLKSEKADNTNYIMLFIFFWMFIPYTISYLQTVYSNPSISFRNLIILSPAVIIMFYAVIEKCLTYFLQFITNKSRFLKQKYQNRKLTVNPMLLSVILSMLLFVKTYGYFSYPSKHDIRSLIKEVSEDSKKLYKNPVMFTTSKTSDQLNYYFRRFSPDLKIKSYIAGEDLQNELIKFKEDFQNHDYLVLFDLKNWGKDSELTIDYFKTNYNLISEKESEGVTCYVFELKKLRNPG